MDVFSFVKSLFQKPDPNNRVVNVEKRIAAPITAAWQSINPNSGFNKAKGLVNAAESQYQTTPEFNKIIAGGRPAMSRTFNGQTALMNGLKADAIYDPSNPVNSIQISPTGNNTDDLIHEGLHRQWQGNNTPDTLVDRQNFVDAYNQSSFPELRSYLIDRLTPYQGFKETPSDSLMNISKLSPELLNEAHSYIPEFYSTHPKLALDGPLADYYAKYFNPAFPQRTKNMHGLAQDIKKLYPQLMNGAK